MDAVYDDDDDSKRIIPPGSREDTTPRRCRRQGARFHTAQRAPSIEFDDRRSDRSNKVVNIHATTQLQVILVKPEKFENAAEIADHLREKRTVVLNLESTNKDVARRLIDFLSGVAYAQDGKIKKVPSAHTSLLIQRDIMEPMTSLKITVILQIKKG